MTDEKKLKIEILEIMNEMQPSVIIPDDNNSKNNVLEILKDLQPVAFFLSVCLVIATFYINNNTSPINITNILMASLFFFVSYLGLFAFRITNFPNFLVFGKISLLIGAWFIFKAFLGIAEKIDQAANPTNGLYIGFLMIFFYLILIMYLLEKVKGWLVRDFCKIFFHYSLYLFTFSLILFGLYLLFHISYIVILIDKIFNLLWITLKISSFLLALVYSRELFSELFPCNISNLLTKFKNADKLRINTILFSGTIIFSIVGTWLLIDA